MVRVLLRILEGPERVGKGETAGTRRKMVILPRRRSREKLRKIASRGFWLACF